MSVFYDNMRALALRMIRDKGVTATLRRTGSAGYDPIGDVDSPTVADYPVDAILLPLTSGDDAFDVNNLFNSYAIDRLTKVMIPAEGLPIVPTPGDELLVAGDTWTIKGVNPVRPDGDSILHICSAVR